MIRSGHAGLQRFDNHLLKSLHRHDAFHCARCGLDSIRMLACHKLGCNLPHRPVIANIYRVLCDTKSLTDGTECEIVAPIIFVSVDALCPPLPSQRCKCGNQGSCNLCTCSTFLFCWRSLLSSGHPISDSLLLLFAEWAALECQNLFLCMITYYTRCFFFTTDRASLRVLQGRAQEPLREAWWRRP